MNHLSQSFIATPAPPAGKAADQVFQTLRAEIVALSLEPGTVLTRPALQERFSLSSTPIRDALLALKAEGLVDIFPQHATRVSLIDIAVAKRAQFLRRAVERELVRQMSERPAPALIARLDGLIRQQAVLAGLGEVEAFAAADQAFHRALYEAGGVGDLWLLVRQRSGHIDRLRHLHLPVAGKVERILGDHRAIVEAMAAGDGAAAEAALCRHLSHSLDQAEALKALHPRFFAP